MSEERGFEIDKVERIFDRWFAVDEATVRTEGKDGAMSKPSRRLSVERGDAAAVVLRHRESRQMFFVRQFRYPTVRHGEPWLMELVAGKVDEGETPEQAAVREIEEEIGYRVARLEALGFLYSSPGGMSEKVSLFFGEVSDDQRTGDGGGVDEGEDVELVRLDEAEAARRLAAGEIHDGKTQLGLWIAREKGLWGA